jgi:hypothetical protein
VEFGAHLPLIDLGAGLSLRALKEFARAASALGYRYLCANDHLLFDAIGLPFDDRSRRFDEALQALRALLEGNPAEFEGVFYSTGGVCLEPRAAQRPAPPIWVASWGSSPGLRRVARQGDGWLASAYNTTPEAFRAGLGRLADALRIEGNADLSPTRLQRPGSTSRIPKAARSACTQTCSPRC